ncbi:N-6 DNA methylase [Phenylobacterium sp.]|uniref:N-6 DNA methylase n=1 Tax=Phenylobacterium sp. TaxID=1871053 RepID=UPI0035B256CE
MHVEKPNLSSVIEEAAVNFAEALSAAAKKAATEADIRSAADRELLKVEEAADIKLEARHEFTVASGRVDSVYDRVIVEYKNPASASDRIGKTLEDGGTSKLLAQIKSRFADLNAEHGQPIDSLFGVGLDGNRILFVRYRDGAWITEAPVPLTPASATRLLWALFNLGSGGRPFSAAYLARDFGGSSPAAGGMVRALYAAIKGSADPKAQTLFAEWRSLFGIVCGYEALSSNAEVNRLATLYGMATNEIDFDSLLFCAHTYYALVMKLLSAEIVGVYHGLPSVTQKILRTPSTESLKRELADLEAGGIFQHIGIRNFLEGDLFSWYLKPWTPDLEGAIRLLVREFDHYNLGSISDSPAESQDLLKDLYMALLPREVRHSLGEYYTPDWVADLTLDQLAYSGEYKLRVLDPACGSGTFLIRAIARIRQRFAQSPESLPGAEKGLLNVILRNIVGFDINPLAVLASRTNFLIAVRDLLKFGGEVELPIFLADSVSTPTEYEDLFTSASPVARVPCAATKPPFLLVPREVGDSVTTVNQFTQAIEHALKVGLSTEEFLSDLSQTGVRMREPKLFAELYESMVKLRDQGRDGIWARIIKNSFAPLFVGRFDLVVGNPPWVNWESLSPEYRKVSFEAWEHYRLTGPLPGKRRQSSSATKTDVCILMTYVSADKYLVDGGQIGFVLPRTIFQSETGGWHFRQFALPSKKPLAVQVVQDIDPLKPFRGQATNTSCVAIFKRGAKTRYPVGWNQWRCVKAGKRAAVTLDEVKSTSKIRKLRAEPIDVNQAQSPWIVGTKRTLTLLRAALGRSPYASAVREGLNTRGANGVFFVHAELLGPRIMVTNLAREGRNDKVEVETLPIEPEYLYPLLRGEDVAPFKATPKSYIVVPHDASDPVAPVQFAKLPKLTREFLAAFRPVLRARKKFRNFDPANGEWHGLYSVLGATFSPFKVVWREMATGGGVIAAAVGSSALPNGTAKVVLPDHKLTIIPCETEEEADYVAGFLNADVTNLIVRSYAVATGISTHILDRVGLPRFSAKSVLHRELASLARKARQRSVSDNERARMSAITAELLGMSHEDAAGVTSELAKL